MDIRAYAILQVNPFLEKNARPAEAGHAGEPLPPEQGDDEEAGKLRVAAVAEEMVRRGRQGSLALNPQEVRRVVDAALAEDSFGEGSEWKAMEGLKPKADGDYDKPDDEAGRKRWFALFEVYRKYRDRYNPQHGEGEVDADEFAKKAQGFYEWYMGGSRVYKDLKEAETDAARDWYCAKAFESLRQNAAVAKAAGKLLSLHKTHPELAERVMAEGFNEYDLSADELRAVERELTEAGSTLMLSELRQAAADGFMPGWARGLFEAADLNLLELERDMNLAMAMEQARQEGVLPEAAQKLFGAGREAVEAALREEPEAQEYHRAWYEVQKRQDELDAAYGAGRLTEPGITEDFEARAREG